MQFHYSVDLYVKTLSGRLQVLKNKENVQLGYPESGRGRSREFLITKFN